MRIFFFITALFSLPMLAMGGERNYTVAGLSMSPALMPGDTVIVSNDLNRPIDRDELVAISFRHRKAPLVKRVVAIPGDRVEVKNNLLLVNNKELQALDPEKWGPTLKQLAHYGSVIPERTLFILGDNPENSRDSRRLGLIPTERVVGRVVKVIKKADQDTVKKLSEIKMRASP
jgi:signal peptidase I